jgi:hypothetical protein
LCFLLFVNHVPIVYSFEYYVKQILVTKKVAQTPPFYRVKLYYCAVGGVTVVAGAAGVADARTPVIFTVPETFTGSFVNRSTNAKPVVVS